MAVDVRWYGQAFFLLTDPEGRRVAIDPFDPSFVRYPVPDGLTADLALSTHEHADHNHVGLLGGAPRVLRGKQGVGEHDFGFCRVHGLGTHHDEVRGKERGPNTVYRLELGGLVWVHLGDLGHLLSAHKVTALQPVDVLFAPLGGHFTLAPEKVRCLVECLAPRVVIGMHYATPFTSNLPLAPPERFLGDRIRARRLRSSEFTLDPDHLPPDPEVWLPGLPAASPQPQV